MSSETPVLIVSDSPGYPSGLSRIARDLTGLLHQNKEHLGIRVGQLGYYHDYDTDWPWPVWKMLDEGHFGQDDMKRTWWRFAGKEPGIIFTIWDPARCSGIMQEAQALPVRLWGYFPIDGTNEAGGFGGPARDVVRRYDRILGYGRWGAEVLSRVSGKKKISYLPHGLNLDVWNASPQEKEYIGCVAANQPRKDLGLLFQTFSLLKQERPGLKFWLHTDLDVGEGRHWSVPELAETYGLNGPDLLVTTNLTDDELAIMYSSCFVTILPTLGEGFGYTIVESLASGVPCISTDSHAGGAELVPRDDWRVKPRGWRLEGTYAIHRPVFSAQEVMRKTLWAMEWVEREPEVVGAYCKGAVAHLDWNYLGGRWLSWWHSRLREVRGEL